MRVAVRVARVEADDVEQLADPDAAVAARADPVHDQRLADDVADRHPRVERRVRVLEDDLHLAPHLAERFRPSSVSSMPSNFTEPEVGFEKLQDAVASRRLARAGLADEAERLAGLDLEADTVDRLHLADLALDQKPFLDREVLVEVLDLEDDAVGAHAGVTSGWRVTARSLAGCAERTQ